MLDDEQQPATDSPEETAGIEETQSVLVRHLLYPRVYIWYVILAACDISLTWIILRAGGREENMLAEWIFRHGGLVGAVVFKFATVIFVVVICEFIGRRRHATGRRVAEWAIALTAIPVVVAIIQLVVVALRLAPPPLPPI